MAHDCSKVQCNWQYAAINSYKPVTGVPIVSPHTAFASAHRKHISCVSHLSSISTLISVLHSLSRISDVVHFGKPETITYGELIKATDAMRDTVRGTTIAVEFFNGQPHKHHMHGGDVIQNIDASVVSVISTVLSDQHTDSWQWNSTSAWAANVFQPNYDSLWVCYNACDVTKKFRLSGARYQVTGVPLHCDPLSGDTVTFNVGTPSLDPRDSTSGEHGLLVRSMASEFMNCVMKDNRCFSCSRILNIHSDMKRGSRHEVAQIQRVRLSDAFARCLMLAP